MYHVDSSDYEYETVRKEVGPGSVHYGSTITTKTSKAPRGKEKMPDHCAVCQAFFISRTPIRWANNLWNACYDAVEASSENQMTGFAKNMLTGFMLGAFASVIAISSLIVFIIIKQF